LSLRPSPLLAQASLADLHPSTRASSSSSLSTMAATSPNPSSLVANQTSFSHLLALPTTFLPLSPSVSALHLARIRLLASLPSPATSSSASAYNPNLATVCCSRCGALSVPGLTASLDVGRSRTRAKKGKARAYVADVAIVGDEGKESAKENGREKERCRSKKKGWNRLRRECLVCGSVEVEKGSDNAVLNTFPSARRTRGMAKRAEDEAALAPMDVNTHTPLPSPHPTTATDSAFTNMKSKGHKPPIPPPLSSLPSYGSTPSSSAAPSPTLSFPSALLSPALSHVPTSHPTPPVLPPPQTPSSLGSVASGGVGGSKEKRKKAKKSGLQKMLAASKEKQGEDKKAGSSLLDWMGELG
jgi:hypothetical protein